MKRKSQELILLLGYLSLFSVLQEVLIELGRWDELLAPSTLELDGSVNDLFKAVEQL